MKREFDNLLTGITEESNSAIVSQIKSWFRSSSKTLAVSESMTGGLLSAELTMVPGASSYFAGGAVCYQPKSKMLLSGVDASLIAEKGAVSHEVTLAMAKGIKSRLSSDMGVAITGVAGPGAGVFPNAAPQGTAFIGITINNRDFVKKINISGTRDEIMREAVKIALRLILIQIRKVG